MKKISKLIDKNYKFKIFEQLIYNLEKILYSQNIDCKKYNHIRLQIKNTDYYSFFIKFYNFANIDMNTHSVRMSSDGFGFGICTSDWQPSRCQMLIHLNGINVWECSCAYNRCLVVKLSLDKFMEIFFNDNLCLK